MDLLSSLMATGFSEYEAKVYLALLVENPATGYQVSKKAGIPRSMVYEALGRLSVRGAVLRADDRRATLYRPLPPEILLDRYEKEHRELVHSLREDLRVLYQNQDEDRLWSISGRNVIISYATQMIQGAEREILLVLSDPDLIVLQAEIEAASQRGIGVSALLTGEGSFRELPHPAQVARHPPLESQLQELTNMLLVAVDSSECLIASTDLAHPESGQSPATITNNRNLILIARQFVWMELFTQRIHNQLGGDLLRRLSPGDRQIFEGFGQRPVAQALKP
jgi:sugar-specific transcriptional regulator TrmB